MIYKKRSLFIVVLLIIVTQLFFYISNNQKNTLRFLIWNIQEVEIGKLISVSFISGLLISTILNISILDSTSSNAKEKSNINNEVKEDNDLSDFEIPPERDIRDPQPTISVNYRVIKNNEKNNSEYDQPYQDDWINDENEW